MIEFKYKASSNDGKVIRGAMSAENQLDLESLLKESNLTLISCSISKISFFSLGGKISSKDMVTLFTHLEQLEKIGVPIIESLADIQESSSSVRLRNIMQGVHESVKNGSLFSEALAKYPEAFDEIFVGLIASGETSGNLSATFTSIIDHLKWTEDIKRKTGKAIRYPLFSLFVMFVVLWVMTTVVVPKVTQFLKAQSIDLPLATRALIKFSDFMQNYALWIIISIPVMVAIYKMLRTIPKIALMADKMKLYIPIFGSIIVKLDISRFCHFFAMNFKSGTGVLECLSSAQSVIGNHAIKESIDIVKQQVADGQPISKAISYTDHFPNLVIRMFRIGEKSGNMEENLDHIRFFYNQEIDDSISRIVGMIQPTLTLIMGGMMAWITISVFGPIYSTFQNV